MYAPKIGWQNSIKKNCYIWYYCSYFVTINIIFCHGQFLPFSVVLFQLFTLYTNLNNTHSMLINLSHGKKLLIQNACVKSCRYWSVMMGTSNTIIAVIFWILVCPPTVLRLDSDLTQIVLKPSSKFPKIVLKYCLRPELAVNLNVNQNEIFWFTWFLI